MEDYLEVEPNGMGWLFKWNIQGFGGIERGVDSMSGFGFFKRQFLLNELYIKRLLTK